MPITCRQATSQDILELQERPEGHLFDRKSRAIKPAKLSQSFSSFSNADGGELIVGIEDDGSWRGFDSMEDANELLSVAAAVMRSDFYSVDFIEHSEFHTFGVLFSIDRHPIVVESTSREVYQRNGAQNRQLSGEPLQALIRSKGESRYELTATSATVDELSTSDAMAEFMSGGSLWADPIEFLRKNLLLNEDHGTIAATLLFSDIPQVHLPNSAVKLYRYRTSGTEERAHLDGQPETLEGPITALIRASKNRVDEIVATIPRLESEGFINVRYPTEALHEILTNALLHRDYGMQDYVHVKIFDNRIEIESPGRLHGQVTVQNILDERSARNPQIQRIINKFPEAPNRDIGEGLNTAFQAMERLRLSYPTIEELSDRVRVTISHEPLASPEKAIMDAAEKFGSINNSEAREVTKIDQERTIRRIFEQLTESGQLYRRGSGRGTRYYPNTDNDESSE